MPPQLVIKRPERQVRDGVGFRPEREVVFTLASATVVAGEPPRVGWPGGLGDLPLATRIKELDETVERRAATESRRRAVLDRHTHGTTNLLITGRTPQRLSVCIWIPFRPEYVFQLDPGVAEADVCAYLADVCAQPEKHTTRVWDDAGAGTPYASVAEHRHITQARFRVTPRRPAYGFSRRDVPFLFVDAAFESVLRLLEKLVMRRFPGLYRCEPFIKQEQRVFRQLGLVFGETHTATGLALAHAGLNCSTYADCELRFCPGRSKIERRGPMIVPLLCLGYDLETYSDDPRVFSNPRLATHEIVCISCVLWWSDDPKTRFGQRTFSRRALGDDAPCGSETDVLRQYACHLREHDPDVLFAYNSSSFDDPFLHTRADRFCKASAFASHGRLVASPCFFFDQSEMAQAKPAPLSQKQKQKAAAPVQRGLLHYFHKRKAAADDARPAAPPEPEPDEEPQEEPETSRSKGYFYAFGRVYIDLMLLVMSTFKQSSYSLQATCAHLLPGQAGKTDLSIRELFAAWSNPEPTPELRRIAEYCGRDAELMCDLADATSAALLTWRAAAVSNVPPSYLYTKGQSCRGLSALFQEAGQKGMVLSRPLVDLRKYFAKYTGAVVLDVVPGLHHNVACEDLASLYPSIMLAWSLCPSSLVLYAIDGVAFAQPGLAPGDLDGVEIDRQRLELNGHTFDVGFVQMRNEALCPAYLDRLLAKRSQEKQLAAQYAAQGEPAMAKLYDAAQAATKVAANSLYGLLGLLTGAYSCAFVAATVTRHGRAIITGARDHAVREGHRVLGGDTDSVFVQLAGADAATVVERSTRFAHELTALVGRAPIHWEYEKVYTSVFFLGKKQRYAWCITKAGDTPKPDHRGVPLRRRDTSPSIVDPLRRVVEHAVRDGLPDLAIRDLAADLDSMHTLPLEAHVKTIRLGASYANPATSIALHLDKRIRASASQPTPMVGERLEYVICRVAGAVHLAQHAVPLSELRQATCAEQPDLAHYIARLEKPVIDVFERTPLAAVARSLFAQAKARIQYAGTPAIDQFCSKRARLS